MGHIWGRQDPGGPHVGPMDFAIRGLICDYNIKAFYLSLSWAAFRMAVLLNSKLSSDKPANRDCCILAEVSHTVKLVCNDHLYNEMFHMWFIQYCVLMKTEGTNLLLLTISAFWS